MRIIAPLLMIALLAATGLAPVAFADDETKASDRKEGKEARKAAKEGYSRVGISLDLAGQAVGRGDAQYTFTLTGTGKAAEKTTEEGLRMHGVVLASFVMRDSDGNIVKEGEIRVKVFAKSDGETTKWGLALGAKRGDGPRLGLHGLAEPSGDGMWNLDGSGRTAIKMSEDARASPVKLTATGSLQRTA